jgi:hypothetical protein
MANKEELMIANGRSGVHPEIGLIGEERWRYQSPTADKLSINIA